MKKTTPIIIEIIALFAATTVLNIQSDWEWSNWSYDFWNHVQVRVGGKSLGITFTNMAIDFASYVI